MKASFVVDATLHQLCCGVVLEPGNASLGLGKGEDDIDFHHVHMTPRVLCVCRRVIAQIKAILLAAAAPRRTLYL